MECQGTTINTFDPLLSFNIYILLLLTLCILSSSCWYLSSGARYLIAMDEDGMPGYYNKYHDQAIVRMLQEVSWKN